MISGLLFRSARLSCFQPKGRRRALMWPLVSATEAGILPSCIRMLPKLMGLGHTQHISLRILILKYVFAVPWNYTWHPNLDPQGSSHTTESRRGSGSRGVNPSPVVSARPLWGGNHGLLPGPQSWGWHFPLSSPLTLAAPGGVQSEFHARTKVRASALLNL